MARANGSTTTKSWYDTPLYYDMVYADYTHRETQFILKVLKTFAPACEAPYRILEPACGSGRLLESLALKGHRLQGFDINPHMLRFARQRLREKKLSAKVWSSRLENFTTPPKAQYDLVHCLVSTFKYILTERGAVSFLRRSAEVLRPEGILLLGVHLTDYRNNPPDHEKWSCRRGDLRVISETWSHPAHRRARTEAMQTRMQITKGKHTEVSDTFWKFRTYSAPELRRLIRQVPEFKIVKCFDFRYDFKHPRKLDHQHSDIILVLQRR
jgi:SAM-dependent methyltransferase